MSPSFIHVCVIVIYFHLKARGILEEILASAGSPRGKGGVTIQQPVYTR